MGEEAAPVVNKKVLLSPYLDTTPKDDALVPVKPKRVPPFALVKKPRRWKKGISRVQIRALRKLVNRITWRMSTEVKDLLAGKRTKDVSSTRHVCCWALMKRGYSNVAIGKVLDIDRQSARYGIRKIEAQRKKKEFQPYLYTLDEYAGLVPYKRPQKKKKKERDNESG